MRLESHPPLPPSPLPLPYPPSPTGNCYIHQHLDVMSLGRILKIAHPESPTCYCNVYWPLKREHPFQLLPPMTSIGPLNNGGKGKCNRSTTSHLMLKIHFFSDPFNGSMKPSSISLLSSPPNSSTKVHRLLP